jgi:hypothetical protein
VRGGKFLAVPETQRLLGCQFRTLLSAAQQAALSNGLQGLATYTTSLAQYGALGQQLPVVDQSIGSALNINGILQNQLVNPLKTAIASASDSNAVASALQNLNYSGNGLTVTALAGNSGETPQDNELQFNLSFDATRTTTITTFDLGANASDVGLSFPGTANVQLTTNLAFSFTFGLELQPNLAPADAFFIRSIGLSFGAMAQLSSSSFNGQIGILAISAQNSATNPLMLNASVEASFSPPDLNAENNITLTDLNNYTPAQMVTLTPTSSLTGTISVSASLGSWATPTGSSSPSITIGAVTGSNGFFSGAAPTISLNSAFTPLLGFNRLTPADFGSVFEQLGNSLTSIAPNLDAPTTNSTLPFLNEPVSQLANFSSMASVLSNGISTQTIQGEINAPTNGQLSANAVFSIAMGNQSPVTVTVTAASTQQNQTLAALASDINSALTAANLSNDLQAAVNGSELELQAVAPVPEPGTLALAAGLLGSAAAYGRLRRKCKTSDPARRDDRPTYP